jgi:5,10-methylenetetrahydromethanopterin reductase
MATDARTGLTPVIESLGAYVLPGRVSDPRAAIGEAKTIEHLGLGTVWISERYGTKDLGVLTGAISQATTQPKIASGISHFLFRHPLSMASMAMTAQSLSNGRFILGIGRSVGPMFSSVGLPAMTNVVLADCADMYRRLTRGERVRYDGAAGKFPAMRLGDMPDVTPPPIYFAAIGPNSMDLAGTHFDGLITHPFLTVDAVRRAATKARRAAEVAGKDPAALRVVATVVVAPDLPLDQEEAMIGGRAVTYFQIPKFGELLAEVNEFDMAEVEKLRAHPKLVGIKGSADNLFTKDELGEVGRSLPRHWLESAAAVGSAGHCAKRLHEYLDAGADELILHGATPELLGPTISHFRVNSSQG